MHQIVDVLAEEFPRARVVSFPGGHAPHIVSMQPFLEHFTGFLSEMVLFSTPHQEAVFRAEIRGLGDFLAIFISKSRPNIDTFVDLLNSYQK